ncbi:MAG: Bax inhibitor-1/YccA family protein [Gammaproteobacteria bacterium]
MQPERQTVRTAQGSAASYQDAVRESALATNKVLRNTYMLLAATLAFSGLTAGIGIVTKMPFLNPILTLAVYFGLLFMTSRFRNSGLGLVCVFALTGFLGLTLGPILSFYLTSVPNGGQLVLTSLGATGLIFAGLSGYVLTTRKDFSFLGGFVMVGMLGLLGVIVLGLFVDLSAMQMAISAGVVVLMAALILYQTSEIINGGETNYILATVTLYVSIYNLFLNLLMLFGLGGDD